MYTRDSRLQSFLLLDHSSEDEMLTMGFARRKEIDATKMQLTMKKTCNTTRLVVIYKELTMKNGSTRVFSANYFILFL